MPNPNTLEASLRGCERLLECDIVGCYDNISHQWMMKHITMDTVVLRKWLAAGYVEL